MACLYVAGLMLMGTLGLLTGCGIAAYRVTEARNENDRLVHKCRTFEVIHDDLRRENVVLRRKLKGENDEMDVSFVRETVG